MVVTNSYFTNQARTLASRNKVELGTRKLLSGTCLKSKKMKEIKRTERVVKGIPEKVGSHSNGECRFRNAESRIKWETDQ